MAKRTKTLVVIGAAAAVVAIGGGAAVAAGSLGGEREAYLGDVAKRLNVTPTELKAALLGAYEDRIDAAVAAGKLTKEQGEALKKRAKENGGAPLFGGQRFRGQHLGFGHHGLGKSFEATAAYLDLSMAELRSALLSGKSLAEIAKAEGKTVDGLKKAMTADLTKKLDAAVKDGKLTQAQANTILERTSKVLDHVVNGSLQSALGRGFGKRGFHWTPGGGEGETPAKPARPTALT